MCFNSPMRRHAGFTWIEILIVVAVIGILAMLAIPSMTETTLRKQIRDAMALAEVAKVGVQAVYALTGELPADNAAAGVPAPEKIVSTLVREVRVQQGAITLEFGNNAHRSIEGKHVTLRPAIVPGETRTPISWICHNVNVPQGMEVRGVDATDVEYGWLPVECRGPPPPK